MTGTPPQKTRKITATTTAAAATSDHKDNKPAKDTTSTTTNTPAAPPIPITIHKTVPTRDPFAELAREEKEKYEREKEKKQGMCMSCHGMAWHVKSSYHVMSSCHVIMSCQICTHTSYRVSHGRCHDTPRDHACTCLTCASSSSVYVVTCRSIQTAVCHV